MTGSNLLVAALDHFNASARGPDLRPFQAAVGEKGLQGMLTPIPAAAHGVLSLLDFPVAVVTAGNKADTAANLTADVLDFDALENKASARGKNGNYASFSNGANHGDADEILWDLKKDQNAFTLIRPRGNIETPK